MKPIVLSLISLVFVANAQADGLPLPVEESGSGVVTYGEDTRFMTVARSGKTMVMAQDTADGFVYRSTLLDGRYSIPLVSYDGTAGGLSGNERTLVLINPRKQYPRKRTTLAVLDTTPRAETGLRLRRLVHLKGDFSYDALSPNGKRLFLINYLAPKDPRKYRVRVYDLQRGRLLPKPIVDPRESPDEMNGLPLAREMSDDGRWAYTLYDGNEHPFIHALDTREMEAVCIDLEAEQYVDPYTLELDLPPGGDTMTVGVRGGKPVAFVDTQSFDVGYPPKPASLDAVREGGSSRPWLAAGLGGMIAWVALVAWTLRRNRRRRNLDALEAELGDLQPAPEARPASASAARR